MEEFGAMTIEGVLLMSATVFSAGAAWGGAKLALNGTKKRVEEIEKELRAHTAADLVVQLQVIDRLARIETKLDDLHDKK